MRDARWSSLVLAAVFVVGFVLAASVLLVRGRLLDESLYTDALARNDAYERVYTEVLADPELAELVEQLLGGLSVDGLDPTQVRALTTSTLRWTIPPSTLRLGTETFVAAVLAYVRGDVERLDPDVDITAVLEQIGATAVAEVRTLLASATDQVAVTLDDYRAAVVSFAEQLAAGTVPRTIPVLGDQTADPAQVADVILGQLGQEIDPQVREQIVAAVTTGDERNGLITATREHAARAAAAAGDRLRGSIEDRGELDVITEIADRASRRRAAVVGQLDSVRDAASWFRPATAVVGGVLMVGAAAGLVWSNRRHPRRAGFVLAATAVAAGVTMLALWTLVTGLVDAPLAPATSTGPGSWNLPGGVRSLLADLEATLGDDLARTVRRLVLFPVVAGAGAAAMLAVAPRLPVPTPGRLVAAGAGAVVVAGVVAGFTVAGAASAASPERLCNGHAELCDRRYDQVVYAATHNSMSSPDVVSVWPEHDGDIRAQLDYGVRALLIDTHHWDPVVSPEQLAAGDPFLPDDLSQQLYDTLGARREARDGAYLCHNQCALGAIPLLDALGAIDEFLAENPDEVVTLIIQDAISPAETADAFTQAGLDPYLHTHRSGAPWATLGEMIDRGERLVVFAEAAGPPPAWYHQAFEHIQETPYRFEQPGDFSCAPNRGDGDASLFLLNHWVQRVAPDRVDAVDVNRHDVVVDRARQCQRQRGQLPNYIAVNFYNLGDLSRAVATLNGLD